MKNFTIENETNNITIHSSAKEAEAVPNSERFGNEAALAKLAAGWPAARLVETWNSLPGETPVKSSRIAPPPYRESGKRSRALARLPPPPNKPHRFRRRLRFPSKPARLPSR